MAFVQPSGDPAGPAAARGLEGVLQASGFWHMAPANVLMLGVALLVLYLVVSRNYEPLMLVPVAFGMLLGNLPLPFWLAESLSAVNREGAFGMTGTGLMAAVLPPLVFLGLGALLDVSAMLSRPKTAFAGAAAQVGIFVGFAAALRAGFTPDAAAAIGLVGSADGPLALFAAGRLAPALMVPVALAAYSYIVLAPFLQPAVAKLLTTRSERAIRMAPGRTVTGAETIACPVAGLLATALLVPGSLPVLGAFFCGNLLKATGVTSQLAKTAANTILDIALILLGVGIGASASGAVVLTRQSAQVFGLGIAAFAVATAAGILFVKALNLFGSDPVNPLVGAAAASALPGSGRMVETMGLAEDPANHLLAHTAGPCVAGLIASALAAGLFIGLS
jgi:oxaloacetate decarboxylase beta subunit